MRLTLLHPAIAIAFALAIPAGIVHADDADAGATDAGITALGVITVTATRTERAVEDVPTSVAVIERDAMDRALVRDLDDLFRYEPGISVTSSYGRFGLGDIRIRGLGGNRVRIETDGIAIPDAFAIGSFSNANRNFVDLDTLKRVEVVRGPASALYGSDALGGVVSFVTKDPVDYLDGGAGAHADAKAGYFGDSDAWFAGGTWAAGGERWSTLVAFGHREGHERENQGRVATADASRTAPNPQDTEGRSLLAKLVYAPAADRRLRLALEGNEDRAATDVLSARGIVAAAHGAPAVRVDSQLGDDRQTRARLSLAHELDALDSGLADALSWQLHRQDSETTQRTDELRGTIVGGEARNPARRERAFDFEQRVHGIEAVAHKSLDAGGAVHTLTYGLDYAHTRFRQKRDGRATNLATGVSTPAIPPDVFPVRDFPVSTTEALALFVQDEIVAGDGTWRIVPALRVDRYTLDPELDAIFAGDNPGLEPSGIDELAISPKLGVVWHYAQDWSLFAGYQHGFRAPPYNDVNLGFTNVQFGYTAIPNPALEPETSDGVELGLRHAGPALRFEASAYYNAYDDFIESMRVVSAPPQTPLRVFQSVNVQEATIRGVEARADLELGALSGALEGWSLRGSAARSTGRDETTGTPLASIDPLRATLGLAYEREAWGIELAGRYARRKDDVATPTQFAPPGYAVYDLLGHWRVTPRMELVAGVFNLADKLYWDWSDVPGVAATSPVLDRYTRPGRNVGVSVSFTW